MPSLLDLADQLWRGRITTADPEHHPLKPLYALEPLSDTLAFYKGVANQVILRTSEGLVMIDTGMYHPVARQRGFENIRAWSADRVHTAIYTHGHVDHAYGLPPFIDEARSRGWAAPQIIAHRDVPARMKRYILTRGYNSIINSRQFGSEIQWPDDPVYPTVTYDDQLEITVGGVRLELVHGRGETDDHTWVFLPESGILCTGDFFIWGCPNAGNPQKAQRYVIEWAVALRRMAARNPQMLLPGHGLPILGEDRVRQAVTETAEYLESLHSRTLAMLNAGATLDEMIHTIRPPEGLAARPYLLPIYDEPEFIVHNLYRLYGGWYEGWPCQLKPAPLAEQAREIAALAGGVDRLLARARQLLESPEAGELRLACHLVDWAALAEPRRRDVAGLRAQVYQRRAEGAASTMARGIFGHAAEQARQAAETSPASDAAAP